MKCYFMLIYNQKKKTVAKSTQFTVIENNYPNFGLQKFGALQWGISKQVHLTLAYKKKPPVLTFAPDGKQVKTDFSFIFPWPVIY